MFSQLLHKIRQGFLSLSVGASDRVCSVDKLPSPVCADPLPVCASANTRVHTHASCLEGLDSDVRGEFGDADTVPTGMPIYRRAVSSSPGQGGGKRRMQLGRRRFHYL